LGYFNATQLELARGRSVLLGRLYHFDFADGAFRCWDGWGTLTFDGQTWLGKGDVGEDSEISFGAGDTAGADTISLSGVSPEIMQKVRESAPVRGRKLNRYGLFFGEDLQPRDEKFLLRISIMDRLVYSAIGGTGRRITLEAESIWIDRNGNEAASYSPAYHQTKFPGDNGLKDVVTMTHRRIAWPRFD
jgi:hypothetical protein